jgi:hypothetical protein
MAEPERRYGPAGGITLGGIIVWVGLIIALSGVIAFGGFARGRWF